MLDISSNLLPALSQETTDTKEKGYRQDIYVVFLLTLQ